MDYNEALQFHVRFEKEVKPIILDHLAYHNKNINACRQWLNHLRSEKKLFTQEQSLFEGDEETTLSEIKFSLTGAKCHTYIHNKDYENAVKYYDLFKVLCYKRIEDTDINEVTSGDKTYTNEFAYIKLCDSIKDELETIEKLIKIVSKAKNVEQILKANRKMIKRKNKNNKA